MRRVTLPDCSQLLRRHGLTADQRRILVRLLVEEGPEALEAWVEREAQRDPYVRERVEAVRAQLERQARRERARLEDRFDAARREAREAHQQRLQEISQREQRLRGRLDELAQGPTLDDLVERSTLLKAALPRQEPASRWERAKRALRRFWLYLLGLWVRLVSWLRGESAQGPAGATIRLPEGGTLDLPHLYAASPALRAEVRRRLGAEASLGERARHWWRRLLGRENYAQVAQQLMEEELAARQSEVERERREQRDRLQEELEQVRTREEAVETDQEEALDRLAEQQEREARELERQMERDPLREVGEAVLDELSQAGLVGEEGRPTEALMERFASLLYEDARRALPGGGRVTPGAFTGSQGEYERRQLRSLNERGHMDLVSTVVRARTHHPTSRHLYDDDILVHREVRTHSTHVVLIFDRSGSMEEHGRFEAAKRVALVLHRAVREQGEDHRVDLLSMSTGVEQLDLGGVWNAEMGGFTNVHAALEDAHDLLAEHDADRKLVYLITDGLPEAYRDEEGQDRVDDPEVCIAYAREAAGRLAELEGCRLLVVQLEAQDPLYLEAAREVVEPVGGRVEALDPEELTEGILLDFEQSAS